MYSALGRQHVVDGSAGTPVSAVTEFKCKQVEGPHLIEASDSGSWNIYLVVNDTSHQPVGRLGY